MVELAFIIPTKFLEDYAVQGDIHLALAHRVLKDKKYADFYRRESKRGEYVILDNSLYEFGEAFAPELLLKAAEKIIATEIVAPDVLYNGSLTVKSFNKFKELLKESNQKDVRVQGVIQGSTVSGFVNCAIKLADRVDTLGLSILSCPKVFGGNYGGMTVEQKGAFSRVESLLHIQSVFNVFAGEGFASEVPDIHYLGLNHYSELGVMNKLDDLVRSNDSSAAFVAGYHKVKFTDNYFGVDYKKLGSFSDVEDLRVLDDEQRECIQHNINVCKRMTSC